MPKAIFVFGTMHSGTTLMATVMGSNSKCHLIAEETGAYSKKHIDHLRNVFVKQTDSIKKEYFVEKTPSHVFNIDKMQEDFSSSFFIVMVRNPIDAVASIYKDYKDFNLSIYSYTNHLVAASYALQRSNTILVEYEKIVKDFDNVVGNVCDFVGLSFETSMKNFHEQDHQWFGKLLDIDEVFKKRAQQMKQPLFDGTGKGYKYLSKEQINQIEFDCFERYQKILNNSA